MFRLHILLLLIIFSFFSCKQQKQEKKLKQVSFSPPVTIIASPPVITLLKDYSPPHILVIPTQGTRDFTIPTLDGPQVISLSAPKLYPLISGEAGGYTYMQNYNTEQGLALSIVACGYSDKFGNLWFGTYGGGVSRYDGKSFTNYTAAQGLAGNLIKTITEDRLGNLWFGTNGSGVSKYDGKSFTNYTTEHGLADNIVKSITEDKKGNLWFCTDNGVSRYNPDIANSTIGKIFTNYTTAQGLLSNTVSSSFEDKEGNIWFGTSAGLNKYDPSTLLEPSSRSFTTFTVTQGLVNNDVRSIGEDNSGNIWFGTRGGVSKYDPTIKERVDGKFFTNYTIGDGLANNNVQNVKKDKEGNIWLATGVGLSKYDPTKKTFINFTTEQGLANNVVYSITEDKLGNLWFGTNGGGLNKYNGKSLTSFSTAQGLVSDKVWSILEDKTGNIWFSTSAGVSKYDGTSFYNIGIPFLTSNDVTQTVPPRGTLAELYQHILDDLNAAIPDLPLDNSTNRFRGSIAGGYSVLSRVYFYARNYAAAKINAELALASTKAVMIDLNGTLPATNFISIHPDVIYGKYVLGNIGASLEFMRSFAVNDRRVKMLYRSTDAYAFTTRGATAYVPTLVTPVFGNINSGTSVQEMKLIAAEGAARANDLTTALQYLDDIRKNRFITASYVKYNSTIQEDVLQEILSERSHELPFGGLRWFDMRRLDKENRMGTVNRLNAQGTVVATLPPHSPKYTLQIPYQVMSFNPGMQQNPY